MDTRPPRSILTDTLFPNTTVFRSLRHDVYTYGCELVHADGAHGPAGEELADERVVGGPHLFLGGELDQVGLVEHGDVVRGAHHRGDVVGRSEERRVGKECVSTFRSRWSPYH